MCSLIDTNMNQNKSVLGTVKFKMKQIFIE